jgi:hypothetical protein
MENSPYGLDIFTVSIATKSKMLDGAGSAESI